MPPVIAALPLIAEITAIGSGAVGIGEGISAATSGGGSPFTTPSQVAPTSSPQDLNAMMESIRKGLPDFQANTGGALSPGSIADAGATSSGNPGELNLAMQAVNAWLGQGLTGKPSAPAGGSQTPTPGGGSAPGFDIQQFIKGLNKTSPGMTYQNPF